MHLICWCPTMPRVFFTSHDARLSQCKFLMAYCKRSVSSSSIQHSCWISFCTFVLSMEIMKLRFGFHDIDFHLSSSFWLTVSQLKTKPYHNRSPKALKIKAGLLPNITRTAQPVHSPLSPLLCCASLHRRIWTRLVLESFSTRNHVSAHRLLAARRYIRILGLFTTYSDRWK
jgi:hypothetical protein